MLKFRAYVTVCKLEMPSQKVVDMSKLWWVGAPTWRQTSSQREHSVYVLNLSFLFNNSGKMKVASAERGPLAYTKSASGDSQQLFLFISLKIVAQVSRFYKPMDVLNWVSTMHKLEKWKVVHVWLWAKLRRNKFMTMHRMNAMYWASTTSWHRCCVSGGAYSAMNQSQEDLCCAAHNERHGDELWSPTRGDSFCLKTLSWYLL